MVQSKRGSYVIPIDTKLFDNFDQSMMLGTNLLPLQHCVLRWIDTARSQVKSVISQEKYSMDNYVGVYFNGMTVIMCDAHKEHRKLFGDIRGNGKYKMLRLQNSMLSIS